MATVTSGTLLGLNTLTYLPTNYNAAKAYPCLIFLPGSGEIGTDPSKLLVNGPFVYLKAGVDLGLDLIVVAVQNVNANPRPVEVQGYITAIKKLYNISAIIGTGLSRGGQDWEWFVNNAESQLAQVSALVLFSSQGTVSGEAGLPGTYTPALFQKHGVKFWQGCGTADSFYKNDKARYTALAAIAPTLAFWDEWAGVGHGNPVWSDGYNPSWTNNSVKQSIYAWAASFGSTSTTPIMTTTTTTSSTTKATSSTTSSTTTHSTTKVSAPYAILYADGTWVKQ